MRKLRVAVLDLVTRAPTKTLYNRLMNANLVSIMTQVVAVWCQKLGHEVTFVCYTGSENLDDELPKGLDILFIGAFTEAALFSYAISNLYRSRGVVTVLGGPHARCYPQDAQRFFDYVLGFTDELTLREVLQDCAPSRPLGRYLSAAKQPAQLPGVRERWPFIASTLRKAPVVKIVPMIASLGCPYTCSFCIDARIPYQPLNFEVMKEDLKFLLTQYRRPRVAWHDPNFGVRFNECLDTIESVVPPGRIDFIAESSLSLLNEPRLQRLKKNGFKALLPGVESWFALGNKTKAGAQVGMEKVNQVVDQLDLVLRYVPYVQANFVLGLDSDFGPEPFELTKRFVDRAPGVFPGYSLLSAFGQAAMLNLTYQRDRRILPHPFHFLNNNQAMNVIPKNYTWPEFYDHVIDLTSHTFSWKSVARRVQANEGMLPRGMNFVRAVTGEGFGRIAYYKEVRARMDSDLPFRRYLEQETTVLPQFYMQQIVRDLGPMFQHLPKGAIEHDPYAYLKSATQQELKDADKPPTKMRVQGEAEGVSLQ